MLRTLISESSHALRTLRRERVFALVAALTLALGIGATTATFGVLRGVLLRPLPYANGPRLVRMHQQPVGGGAEASFSVQEIADYTSQSKSIDGIAEYHAMSFIMVGRGDPRRVQTGVVSADFFDILGVRPLLGRSFRKGEDQPGAAPVLLLSYEFWRDQLGSDPTVIGTSVHMTDRDHTIIGVLPPLPVYPDRNDVYMPTSSCPFRASPAWRETRTLRALEAVARLTPSTTNEQTSRELGTISTRLHREFPAAYATERPLTVTAAPFLAELTAGATPRLALLGATALLVLLVASANAASLTFVRQLRRRRELAVRASLGASHARLLYQVVLESVLVALAGAAGGIALAAAAIAPLRTLVGQFTPRAAEVRMDATVLAFGVAIAIVSGILVGALPFPSAVRSLADALRDGGDRSVGSRGARRIERGLVVLQLAACVVLLTAAGLAGRSLARLAAVDAGFDARGVVTVRLSAARERFSSGERVAQFNMQLFDRLASIPGATHVALAASYPLAPGAPMAMPMRVEGIARGGSAPLMDLQQVSPGYFRTIGTPLVRGRDFDASDTPNGTEVAIVNESLAKRLWAGKDPLGHRVSFDNGESWITIVGIAGDVRQYGLASGPSDAVYAPLTQAPSLGLRAIVRGRGDAATLAKSVIGAAREVDPVIAADEILTLDQARGDALAGARLTAMLLTLLAVVATAIAASGVGGVLATSVSRRRREFGLRLALGADRSHVLWTVLRDTVVLAALGLAIGVAASLSLGRLMRAFVFEVAPNDPLTLAAVCATLAAVALVASAAPARRAARVEPMVAMRD